MKRSAAFPKAIVFGAILIVTGCGREPAAFDQRLAALQAAIGNEPLTADATDRLSDQKAELEALTDELEKKRPGKNPARRDWQIGECHRLRHLFDEQDAWEEAERRLSVAIARDPKMAAAHLSLGQLYLTGGAEFAARAERELTRALEEGDDVQKRQAHRGLFLACYYQGRWADAVEEADKYLAADTDDAVKKMRDMAETNLKREKREKK
jgi:tetratricopeptide (TPR) repeat protein